MNKFRISPTVGQPAVILASDADHARRKAHILADEIWEAEITIAVVEDLGPAPTEATTE